MMPASRAAPSTSPFMALPSMTRSRVSLRMMTLPSATATRSVCGLAETSTMRASPRWSMWLSLGSGFAFVLPAPREADFVRVAIVLLRRCRACIAPQQGTGRGGDVGLAHQALSDQEGRDADAGKAGEIGRRVDAALADDDSVARHQRSEALADVERSLEGAQVAVVDANQARAQPQGPLKLIFLMNFNKNVHA